MQIGLFIPSLHKFAHKQKIIVEFLLKANIQKLEENTIIEIDYQFESSAHIGIGYIPQPYIGIGYIPQPYIGIGVTLGDILCTG